MKILVSFAKLAVLVVLGFVTVFFVSGVFYWWQVLPSEDVVLTPQGADDVFVGLRLPAGTDGQTRLYSDTLSPLVLEGLGLPTSKCANTHRKWGWHTVNGPLILYLRSTSQTVAFCSGGDRSCWTIELVLSNIAGRLKYSKKAQVELYLMLISAPPVEIACEEIIGHSCRDVSPEEAVIVSKWVRSPIGLMDNRPDLRLIQEEAAVIAASCRMPYLPATGMNLLPPYQGRRLPKVSFTYSRSPYATRVENSRR